MKPLKRQLGITLIEMLITIAVAAILLGVAAPGFNTVIKNNRLSTSSNQFVSHLSMARSEATKRGSFVSVCKSTDMATCNNSANWENGWIVFVDKNGNRSVDGGDSVIRTHQGLPRNTLRGSVNIANGACFSSRGFAGCGGASDGIFTLCDDRRSGNNARNITIAASGMVSTSVTTTAGCP